MAKFTHVFYYEIALYTLHSKAQTDKTGVILSCVQSKCHLLDARLFPPETLKKVR